MPTPLRSTPAQPGSFLQAVFRNHQDRPFSKAKGDSIMRNSTSMTPKIMTVYLVAVLVFLSELCFAAEFASIIKDGVNIRSGPSTKHEVLWEVFREFPVEILQRQGDWVQVKDFEDDTGWVYSSLLANTKTMIVKVETANMRSGPSTDDKIIATVKKGVVFTPLEQQGSWIKVRYKNDITGWIYNTLLFPDQL
jgi:SH3-like domain-containing protein